MVHVLNESDYFRHIQCVTAVYWGEIQSVLYASPCDITPYIMSWCWEPKSSSCDGIFEAVLHNKGSKSRKSPYKTNCIPCFQANLFVLVMVSSLKLYAWSCQRANLMANFDSARGKTTMVQTQRLDMIMQTEGKIWAHQVYLGQLEAVKQLLHVY